MARIDRSEQALPGAWVAGIVLVLACGCVDSGAGLGRADAGRALGGRSTAEFLADTRPESTTRPWPGVGAAIDLEGERLVVFTAEGTVDPPPLSQASRDRLRTWVEDGGSLVLFGPAIGLAHELGFEPTAPVTRVFRWGQDGRTALGRELHFLVAAAGAEPAAGAALLGLVLDSEDATSAAYPIAGGTAPVIPVSGWAEPPLEGSVVAHLARRVDEGSRTAPEGAVIVRWSIADGEVLACGVRPETWRDDDIGGNARRLLDNLVQHGAPFVVFVPEPRDDPSTRGMLAHGERRGAIDPDPAIADRTHPGVHGLRSWGWQVAATWLHPDRTPFHPQRVFDEVLLPSWRAGADRVDLRLADEDLGYPFVWTVDDPMRRPDDWFGGSIWENSWSSAQVRRVAEEARRRSMTVQLDLSTSLVRDSGLRQEAAAMRYLARELLDPRLQERDEAPIDGFVLRAAGPDPAGVIASLLRPFAPEVELYQPRPWSSPRGDDVAWLLDADRGRPGPVVAAGLSAAWRDLFDPESFPAAVLDARAKPADASLWSELGGGAGGGSFGDWIVTQLQDFVRPRRKHADGARVWWRSYHPSLLDERIVGSGDAAALDYVHGASLDPLRCAVAGQLEATGRGGWRDRQRALHGGDLQDGFGAESDLAAETPFLQNAHFRLHGSGGPLLFDPTATAWFRERSASASRARAAGAVRLADSFLRTRIRGFQPTVDGVEQAVIDVVGGAPRSAGGYERVVRIEGAMRGLGTFPAALARGAVPEWPERVEVGFQAVRGRYRLDLATRGRVGKGLLRLRADGVLIAFVPFDAGDRSQEHTFDLQFPAGGHHVLELEVLDGGAVGVSVVRLARIGDSAAAIAIPERAGWRARLREHFASSYYEERAELTAVADFPGFVIDVDIESAASNVQVVREVALPFHRSLGRRTPGDGAGNERLRRTFVLASNRSGIPDLAVVPLRLPRQHWFYVDPAAGSTILVGHPRANQRLVLGFVFLVGAMREASLEQLTRACHELVEPVDVRIEAASDRIDVFSSGGDDERSLTRARLLQIHHRERLPFFVQERGTWWFRGTQPSADDGGALLLVRQVLGAPVRIAAWNAPSMKFVPGPGSLHSVGLRGVDGRGCEVVVVRAHETGPAPSVVARVPLGDVFLDGVRWDFVGPRGRIGLPRVADVARIEVRSSSGPAARLWRTDADVRRCSWDPASRVLEILTMPRESDPEREFFALVAGPTRPGRIDGGELVPDAMLGPVPPHEARAPAHAIRFHAGLLRIHFGTPAPAEAAAPDGGSR